MSGWSIIYIEVSLKNDFFLGNRGYPAETPPYATFKQGSSRFAIVPVR